MSKNSKKVQVLAVTYALLQPSPRYENSPQYARENARARANNGYPGIKHWVGTCPKCAGILLLNPKFIPPRWYVRLRRWLGYPLRIRYHAYCTGDSPGKTCHYRTSDHRSPQAAVKEAELSLFLNDPPHPKYERGTGKFLGYK